MAVRQNKIKEILAEYDDKKVAFEEMATNAEHLIAGFIRESEIALHSVAKRVKSRSSLDGKLRRPGKSYRSISDITDIVGVRLTTYFSADVDRVAEIVEREFLVDGQHSVDKRIHENPDRFGYQSLHYIVEYKLERCALSEYRRFSGLKFEIQIRSILQHAWAEIEHDLGYKSPSGIPADVRRRFARIAGLLELADIEFSGIREQLGTYEASLPQRLQTNISTQLDQAVLQLLVHTSPALKALDQAVCAAAGAELAPADPDQLASSLKKLRFFNISDTSSLVAAAQANIESVGRFAEYWLEKTYETLNAGIGLFYLCYVLASKEGPERAKKYLEIANIDLAENRTSLALEIAAFSADPA